MLATNQNLKLLHRLNHGPCAVGLQVRPSIQLFSLCEVSLGTKTAPRFTVTHVFGPLLSLPCSLLLLQKQLWASFPVQHQSGISLWGTRIQLCCDTVSAVPPEATRGQGQGAENDLFWRASEDCDHILPRLQVCLESRFGCSGGHLGSFPGDAG